MGLNLAPLGREQNLLGTMWLCPALLTSITSAGEKKGCVCGDRGREDESRPTVDEPFTELVVEAALRVIRGRRTSGPHHMVVLVRGSEVKTI